MNDIRLSKKMSLILRHRPELAGVELEDGGWMGVSVLLKALDADRSQMDRVVADNNKQRFEFSEDGKKIRARQGHSVVVDLGYEECVPPEILYHGTATKNLGMIYKHGIKRMKRHHVHLSGDYETAYKVGQRHGKPAVLLIDAKRMSSHGIKFYKTANDVWLVNYVSPEVLKS